MMKLEKYIGIMSGTSLDGIDTVLAAINDKQIIEQASYTHPLPVEIKQRILAICQGQKVTLSQFAQLDTELGILFADAVQNLLQQAQVAAEKIKGIGNHGQTVWHQPSGQYATTLQIADNNRIAGLTGITTVGDFRRRDMVFGGQGAPLVPAFHQAILSHDKLYRVILNIGGIANITLLFPGKDVLGYDTGPGNMLLDAWIWQQKQQAYDVDGQWAKQGQVLKPLLDKLLADDYFSLPLPKSTGREYFNIAWLERQLADFATANPADVQATLLEFTAVTIVDQIKLHGCRIDQLLVCGGGASNPVLMARLASLLPNTEVNTTDSVGVSSDNMEALAFAWLAYRTLTHQPGNLPTVTGASSKTILGAVYFV